MTYIRFRKSVTEPMQGKKGTVTKASKTGLFVWTAILGYKLIYDILKFKS